MLKDSLLVVEKCNTQNQSFFISGFGIPHNYVFYFENDNDVDFNLYIRQNIESLTENFKTVGKNFVYLPLVEGLDFDLISILEYYSPQLAYKNLAEIISKEFSSVNSEMLVYKMSDFLHKIHGNNTLSFHYDYQILLEALGCANNINSGLIIKGFDTYAIGASEYFRKLDKQDYSLFFSEVIDLIPTFSIDYKSLSFCPKREVSSEQLDDEAKKIIKDLEEKLNKLEESGQLLFLIPVLRDVLDKQVEKLDLNKVSKIQIDSDNRIWLPYFNKEVELSHLTKAVYFLFLKHPEGINLNELFKHRNELLTIYISVSNQLNYDKMTKSVDDIVNLDTKAIYTHISRIKSAYYKLMDESYAQYYIVSGHGEEERKVDINPNGIEWAEVNELDDYIL